MPVGVNLPKMPTHRMMLEKLQELFPEMVEGVQWDLAEGVIWNELGRKYRCFRQQGTKVSTFELLDCPTDDEQVTLLTLLNNCNIVRNMSLHDIHRTNFVRSELLIWTKYLQYALQRMYEVANEID